MEKRNYIFLGIILFILWVVDILNFFKLADIWYWIKVGYVLFGGIAWILSFAVACPDTENKSKIMEKTTNNGNTAWCECGDALEAIPIKNKEGMIIGHEYFCSGCQDTYVLKLK